MAQGIIKLSNDRNDCMLEESRQQKDKIWIQGCYVMSNQVKGGKESSSY